MSEPQLGHWSFTPWKRANLRNRRSQTGHSTREPALKRLVARRNEPRSVCLKRAGSAAFKAGTESTSSLRSSENIRLCIVQASSRMRKRGRCEAGTVASLTDSPLRALVLCYHSVSDDWEHQLAVRPRAFERQLASLLRRGFRPVGADAVLDG